MRNQTLISILLILPLTLSASVAAQDYEEEILDNGLRVVTIVRPEVPMVTMATVVGAGSALEEEDFDDQPEETDLAFAPEDAERNEHG